MGILRKDASPRPSGGRTDPRRTIYRMQTFLEWSRFQSLLEAAWYSFDPAQYNTLFDSELEKVIARVRAPPTANLLSVSMGSIGSPTSLARFGTQATVTNVNGTKRPTRSW